MAPILFLQEQIKDIIISAPKLQLESADGDKTEPVRVCLREHVSSPCWDDGGVNPAGRPLGGGGCVTLQSARKIRGPETRLSN